MNFYDKILCPFFLFFRGNNRSIYDLTEKSMSGIEHSHIVVATAEYIHVYMYICTRDYKDGAPATVRGTSAHITRHVQKPVLP